MATPIEVLQGSLASGSTTTNVTITTAVDPSDLIVLVTATGALANTIPTPSGLGTWRQEVLVAATQGLQVHTLTGRTGGGTVTLTRSSTSSTTDYVLFVVRGLDVPVVDAIAVGATSSSATTELVLAARARGNTVALSILRALAGTPANPATGSDPSSGWTTHRNGSGSNGVSVATVDIATGQDVTARTTFGGSVLASNAALLVLGTPNESRNFATQLEALTGPAGHPPATLRTEYLEAATSMGPPPRALATEYLEALTYARPPSELATEYLEAITTNEHGGSGAGTVYAEALTEAPTVRKVQLEYLEALAPPVAPAPPALLSAAYLETLSRARQAEAVATYLEVLRSAVDAPPGGDASGMVWGVRLY